MGIKPASALPPKVQQEKRITIDGAQKNFPSGCKTLNGKKSLHKIRFNVKHRFYFLERNTGSREKSL
jgi:hypothetical protein